jgi:hypothetical protein
MSRVARSVSLLLAAGLLGACANDGAEGKSCTMTPECLSGLVCDNPGGGAGSGTCRKPGDVPPRLDAAIPDGPASDGVREAGAPDRAADAPVDAAVDRAAGDGGGDGATPDAGDGSAGDGAGDAGDGPATDAAGDGPRG